MAAQLVTANVIKWERLDPFALVDRHGFPRAGFASYTLSIFSLVFGPLRCNWFLDWDWGAGMTREPGDRTLVEAGMEPIQLLH